MPAHDPTTSTEDQRSESEEARREKRREAKRAYRKAHPEKEIERRRRRRIALGLPVSDREARRSKAYYEAHREELCEYKRSKHYHRKYGITLDQFEETKQAQGGRCLICRTLFSLMRQLQPCVDHCHRTGKNRGILCRMCNTMLGSARDNPQILRAAIKYLQSHGD